MGKIELREWRSDEESGLEAMVRAEAEGWTLGVYGDPVEPEGIYPATVSECLDAWREDPGLVYVVQA